MAKQKEEKVPPIKVKEAYYCPNTKGVVETEVQAVEVGWGVPTVEKLWLGYVLLRLKFSKKPILKL